MVPCTENDKIREIIVLEAHSKKPNFWKYFRKNYEYKIVRRKKFETYYDRGFQITNERSI